MDLRRAHWQLPFLVALLLVALGSQCSSSSPPPSAPPNDTEKARNNGSGFDVDSSSADSAFDDLDEDTEKDDKGDDKSSGSKDGSCADVGGEDIVEACNKCGAEGKFFDRTFENGEGKCTRLELAETKCTEAAVQEFMSSGAKAEFKRALNGSFEDFVLDQCVDCPPDSGSPYCESNSGTDQIGTKLYFVMEDDDFTIRFKNILIKARPGKDDGNDEE